MGTKKTLSSWAEKEIEYALSKAKDDNYAKACYESAFRAFKSLMSDGHSGLSIGYTKMFLNRLIDGKPLTPIYDTPDIWDLIGCDEKGRHYQCTRQYSLFKDISRDGKIKHFDNNRFVCVDIHRGVSYNFNFAEKIVDEMEGAITFPYMPSDKQYKIFIEDFLTDDENGDFDTVGILYYVCPDGTRKKVNRYFKSDEHDFELQEIDYNTYFYRKRKAIRRKENK